MRKKGYLFEKAHLPIIVRQSTAWICEHLVEPRTAIEEEAKEVEIPETPVDLTADMHDDSPEITTSQLEADFFASPDRTDSATRYLREIGKIPLLNAEQEVALGMDIEAGLYARYKLQHAGGAGAAEGEKLSLAMLHDLSKLAKRGESAKDHLIGANLRLVVYWAKRFRNRGLPFLDLIQEGNMGLIRAVEKYDYAKGYRFSTYASWWIRQAISRGLTDTERMIRIPVYEAGKIARMMKVRRDLTATLGREPHHQELADGLGVSLARLRELQLEVYPTASLDAPTRPDSDSKLGDSVIDPASEEGYNSVVQSSIYSTLQAAVGCLTDRERLALALRYGEEPMSVYEVGRQLSLTSGAADWLLRRCMAKLAHPAAGLIPAGQPDQDTWQLQGTCREIGLEMFFPREKDNAQAQVVEICDGCPVQEACRTFALEEGIATGIWGGITVSERRRLLAADRSSS